MSGLKQRRLIVTISLPGGDVVLDDSLDIHVRIHKNALAIQNKATIEVTNMLASVRQQLLSNFTAWQKNQRDQFGVVSPYWNVTIKAGYLSADGTDTTSTIYKGQVVQCDLVSSPPNVRVRISCYTNQVDKTKFITDPMPYQQTFRELVFWAGNQMGFDNSHIKCSTSFDENIIYNAARSIVVAAALLPYIQDYYHPDVAAFIDDDFLIVKDRNAVIDQGDIVILDEFIGIPNWTEWGVEGTVLLDPSIHVAGGAQFESILNPSLGSTQTPGQYVVLELEYDLASRDTPFYIKVSGIPPAA